MERQAAADIYLGAPAPAQLPYVEVDQGLTQHESPDQASEASASLRLPSSSDVAAAVADQRLEPPEMEHLQGPAAEADGIAATDNVVQRMRNHQAVGGQVACHPIDLDDEDAQDGDQGASLVAAPLPHPPGVNSGSTVTNIQILRPDLISHPITIDAEDEEE